MRPIRQECCSSSFLFLFSLSSFSAYHPLGSQFCILWACHKNLWPFLDVPIAYKYNRAGAKDGSDRTIDPIISSPIPIQQQKKKLHNSFVQRQKKKSIVKQRNVQKVGKGETRWAGVKKIGNVESRDFGSYLLQTYYFSLYLIIPRVKKRMNRFGECESLRRVKEITRFVIPLFVFQVFLIRFGLNQEDDRRR